MGHSANARLLAAGVNACLLVAGAIPLRNQQASLMQSVDAVVLQNTNTQCV